MDESSYLDPAALQAQCSGAIQVLERDREAIHILEGSLDSFVNNGEIQGASFGAMKQHISDYKTVLQAIVAAHESDQMDFESLRSAAVGEVLDGSKIIPNKKKAKKNQEKYERQADEYLNMACSCPPLLWSMASVYMGMSVACRRMAQIEQQLYEKWKKKEETYDDIEAATSGLFSASSGMRAAINSALSGIKGAFHVSEGYVIDRSAPWRREIGAAKISLIKKQLNQMGIEPDRVQELTEMGFTYEGLWGYRLMCGNEQEKEFYIQVLLGTEESYVKAFEINPYDLNDGMTIFMADYASRLLELGDDGTATEESTKKIMEFNNALLQSELYCVDGEGNFTDEKYRNVYLNKIATGTEALLMKEVLQLAGMNRSDGGYDVGEKLYNQRCSMTLFWTTEADVVKRFGNVEGVANLEYSISGLSFTDFEASFYLNHFSSLSGKRVSDHVMTDIRDGEDWKNYFKVDRLNELKKAKEEAVPRALLNVSKDMLLVLYADVSVPGAAVTEMMLTAANGSAPALKGIDGYLDENGKLGLNMGNTLYTGLLNGYIGYNNASMELAVEEWSDYLEWFGKGGTYVIDYEDDNVNMPTGRVAFAGCYNPDTMRGMELWRENGMEGWCNWETNDLDRMHEDNIEKIAAEYPDFDKTAYFRVLYGENNDAVQSADGEVTIQQFYQVMGYMDKNVITEDRENSNIYDQFIELGKRGAVK